VKAQSPLIRRVTRETVKFQSVSHEERFKDAAVRGVFPEYGEMRNEVPSDGRWISPEDIAERRRVVFIGAELRKKLFSGEPSLGLSSPPPSPAASPFLHQTNVPSPCSAAKNSSPYTKASPSASKP